MSKEKEVVEEIRQQEKQTLTSVIDSQWYRFSRNICKKMKGKFLTMIDATFQDPQQRKAQKDIVSQMIDSFLFDDFNPAIKVSSQIMSKELGEDSIWGGDERVYFSQFEGFHGEQLPENLKYEYSRKEK